MEWNHKNLLTLSAFQFEEKFIEKPEDLDKLKNGKPRNEIPLMGVSSRSLKLRFQHHQRAVCVVGVGFVEWENYG